MTGPTTVFRFNGSLGAASLPCPAPSEPHIPPLASHRQLVASWVDRDSPAISSGLALSRQLLPTVEGYASLCLQGGSQSPPKFEVGERPFGKAARLGASSECLFDRISLREGEVLIEFLVNVPIAAEYVYLDNQ